MYLILKHVTLFKQTGTSGTISVVYADKKRMEDEIRINEIKLDMNNGVDPISCYRVSGNPIISGHIFDLLKRFILVKFKTILNDKDAIGIFKYDVSSNIINKV